MHYGYLCFNNEVFFSSNVDASQSNGEEVNLTHSSSTITKSKLFLDFHLSASLISLQSSISAKFLLPVFRDITKGGLSELIITISSK